MGGMLYRALLREASIARIKKGGDDLKDFFMLMRERTKIMHMAHLDFYYSFNE